MERAALEESHHAAGGTFALLVQFLDGARILDLAGRLAGPEHPIRRVIRLS